MLLTAGCYHNILTMTCLYLHLLFTFIVVLVPVTTSFSYASVARTSASRSTVSMGIQRAPFEDIIPFLSEHIQKSDQLLFLGLSSDLAIQLSKEGYGTSKTGFMTVVDTSKERVDEAIRLAEALPETKSNMQNKKLDFTVCDYSNMPEVCKQSVFDAIVDFGGIDSLLLNPDPGYAKALRCIDHLQNAG